MDRYFPKLRVRNAEIHRNAEVSQSVTWGYPKICLSESNAMIRNITYSIDLFDALKMLLVIKHTIGKVDPRHLSVKVCSDDLPNQNLQWLK